MVCLILCVTDGPHSGWRETRVPEHFSGCKYVWNLENKNEKKKGKKKNPGEENMSQREKKHARRETWELLSGFCWLCLLLSVVSQRNKTLSRKSAETVNCVKYVVSSLSCKKKEKREKPKDTLWQQWSSWATAVSPAAEREAGRQGSRQAEGQTDKQGSRQADRQ